MHLVYLSWCSLILVYNRGSVKTVIFSTSSESIAVYRRLGNDFD